MNALTEVETPASRRERWRFRAWLDRLERGTPLERMEAARSGFEECPERGLEPLTAALNDPLLEVRLPAISSLARLGAVSTEALVSALDNKCLRTRMAAAEALGQVGDRRAVEPLSRYLQDRISRSPFKQRWLINLGHFVIPSAFLSIIAFSGVKGSMLIGVGISMFMGTLLDVCTRQSRSRQIRCYANAIRRVAEREAVEDARDLIPTLAAVATDVVMQNGAARRACQEAAAALQGSTSVLTLPVVAAPPPSAESLPIPAGAGRPPCESLPRIHEPKE